MMMTQATYTVKDAADYLGLTEKETSKLVEKGILDGTRIRGEWIIPTESIVEYLEQGIHKNENRMEEFMRRQNAQSVSLLDHLPEEMILVPFNVRTRPAVFRDLTRLAFDSGRLWDAAKMAELLEKREETSPTVLGNGVALLHPLSPQPSLLGEDFVMLGITPSGIPFGGTNKTDIFFAICSTDFDIHLAIMQRIAQLLKYPDFLEQIREASSSKEVRNIIKSIEKQITPDI
ncbi:MAG: PTS sugar transporter subunit IIA [Planctomycetia bacterium]|nr:PTS sugar transporter subunit IIA [Planctomycetia bacterium]